jgi:pyocin large subunit-like protein
MPNPKCTSVISRLLLLLAVLAIALAAAGPGFRSSLQFDEHFAKHGAEFGKVTRQQYLKMAQDFRDAPKEGDILEVVRDDHAISRFHKKKRWFLAFNKDRTIRTFFIPNKGERYFWRQAKRPAPGND